MHAVTPVATAMAADLVQSVEAYLEANGLSDTLKALKSEASAKKMTPSKSVRAPETPLDIARHRNFYVSTAVARCDARPAKCDQR